MRIINRLAIAAYFICLTFHARDASASPTPIDAKLSNDAITEIECAYTTDGPIVLGSFKVSPNKQAYHYKVYIPQGYDDHPKSNYPCVFIASPGGSASLDKLEKRVKKDRLIAIMLVESQNGPWEPIVGNFLAAHDDAVKRLRITEGLKFATGFSGGARASSLFCALRPGFSGLVMQSAGLWDNNIPYTAPKINPLLSIYMLMGNIDGNRSEIQRVRQQIPPQTPFRYEVFAGAHHESSEDGMNRAFDFIDEMIYTRAPTLPQLKSAYIQRALLLIDQAGDPSLAPFEKYELLDAAIKLASARAVAAAPELKKPIADAQAELKALAKDPSIKTEQEARAAFEKISNTEEAVRNQPANTPRQSQTWSAQAAAAYTDLAAKYAATSYGQRAAKIAELRQAESSEARPPASPKTE